MNLQSAQQKALELLELSNSQQSVQPLSLWLIHHRKHTALIVGVWEQDLRKMLLRWLGFKGLCLRSAPAREAMPLLPHLFTCFKIM
uniref:CID domain-containing protein n=1 Tax=Meleagris gallopavo TaxID=9103 RepID=A0A803XWK4_MELGA